MDALLSKNSALAYNTNIHPIPKFEKKNSFPGDSILRCVISGDVNHVVATTG